MKQSQIAINLESVQDRITGTKEIVATVAGLKKAGFENLEIHHFFNPDDGTTWRQILDDYGMKAIATHELLDEIKGEPDRIIEKAVDMGCHYVSMGLAQSVVWEDIDSVKKMVCEMNALNEAIRKAGLELLYHNHNMEFAKLTPDLNAMEYVFAEMDPTILGELDLYWIQLSGNSPEKWCKKLGKRLRAVHLKDLAVTGGTYAKYIKTPTPAVLGGGNMDFESIVAACDEVGVEWYIIETHTNWVDGDSLKTAAISYNYLANIANG